jgi:hypothetical protein
MSFAQALMNGVPLPSKHLSGDEFEEVMLMEVMRNTQVLLCVTTPDVTVKALFHNETLRG